MKKDINKMRTNSLYWDWVSKYYEDGKEPVEANPDQISQQLVPERNEEVEALKNFLCTKITKLCTKQERKVVILLQKGYNQTEIAKELRVKTGTINTLIKRVREKAVNFVYENPVYGVYSERW